MIDMIPLTPGPSPTTWLEGSRTECRDVACCTLFFSWIEGFKNVLRYKKHRLNGHTNI